MKSLNKEKGMDFLKRVTMITVAALIMAGADGGSDSRRLYRSDQADPADQSDVVGGGAALYRDQSAVECGSHRDRL